MDGITPKALGRLLLGGLASISLGCAHGEGPYPNPSRVAQGAIVGSMAGAAIGAGLDHRNRGRGAVVGAVSGLLAGAVFGRQLERHPTWQRAYHEYDPRHDEWCDGEHAWEDEDDHTWDDDERDSADRPDREPEREGSDDPAERIGRAPHDVLFDRGSAKLSGGARSQLRRVADLLEDEDLELLLRGHSDGSGSEGFDLSEQRARSVRAFLAEEGVPSRRIAWVGFGDAQPLASPNTSEGRQRNRRVEIVLREPDSFS